MALNQVGLERLNTATTKKIGINKNLIINGALQVAQRGTSSTTSGYGTVDMFRPFYSGTDEAPTQAQVDVSSGTTPYTSGFRKSLKITNGNQTSGAGTADVIEFATKLEAQDIANSGWNYTSASSFITLSFWVKSSVAQNFYGQLVTTDGTSQNYPFETGSLTADTWTKVTKTIPGNSNLQFDNNADKGIDIKWIMFRGTDTTGSVSLNAWAANNNSVRVPNNTSTWYTTNDATFEVTGVQLEVGSVATDFEFRSFAQELALCQRYFFAIPYGSSSNNTQFISSIDAFAVSTSEIRAQVHFPVPMRSNASYTGSSTNIEYNSSNNSDHFNASGLADYLSITGENAYGMSLRKTSAASIDAGTSGHFIFRATGGFLQFSAEL